MRAVVTGIAAIVLSANAVEAMPRADASRDSTTIRTLLARSAEAWSMGNLDDFMRLYEDGPGTTYVGSDGIVSGRDKIRDLYRNGFGSGAIAMGRLSITPEAIRYLGRDYALVTGHYAMERPAGSGKVRKGVFTLVFHRSRAGWGVISDHSS